VVGGDKDIVTKLEASRTIAEESPLASLRTVEGVNHMGPLERADLYNALIAEFTLAVQPARAAGRGASSGEGPFVTTDAPARKAPENRFRMGS
jgi:hypothetical protein